MTKARLIRYAIATGGVCIVALALAGSYYVYSQQTPKAADQAATPVDGERLQEQFAASSVAILTKMTREKAQISNMAAICLANTGSTPLQDFSDIAVETLQRIKANFAIAQQYSFCRASFTTEYVGVYAIESIQWQPNGNVLIAVVFRDGLNGKYADSEVYELQKSGANWTVVRRWPGWITQRTQPLGQSPA